MPVPGMEVHTCNPSTSELMASKSLGSEACLVYVVQVGQRACLKSFPLEGVPSQIRMRVKDCLCKVLSWRACSMWGG